MIKPWGFSMGGRNVSMLASCVVFIFFLSFVCFDFLLKVFIVFSICPAPAAFQVPNLRRGLCKGQQGFGRWFFRFARAGLRLGRASGVTPGLRGSRPPLWLNFLCPFPPPPGLPPSNPTQTVSELVPGKNP